MIKKILIFLPVFILLTISFYFVLTSIPWIRYWADDFCSATLLKNTGYFSAQISWWNSWTGRYAYIAFLDFFELIGSWSVNFLPLTLLAGASFGLYGFYKYGKMLPLLFITLTLINAPNIIQSFYWQTGSLNYFAPFIFLNILLSMLVVSGNEKFYFIAAPIMFVAGGFSEAFALASIPLLVIIILFLKFTDFKNKKDKIRMTIWGLMGLTLSLLIMYISPGNAVRSSMVTNPASIIFVIKSTILGTKWFLLRMLGVNTFIYSIIVTFSSVFLLGKKYMLKRKQGFLLMISSALVAIFSTMAVIGSGFYSMSILPPERTLFIAVYIILFSVFAFSFALRSILGNNFSWFIILLNIIFVALISNSTISHWRNVRGEMQIYAQKWDEEKINLENQIKGGKKPELENIKAVGDLDDFKDNKGWVASCLAGYYQLKSIKIVE